MAAQVYSGPQLRPASRLRIFIYELPHELVQVQSITERHTTAGFPSPVIATCSLFGDLRAAVGTAMLPLVCRSVSVFPCRVACI